MTPAEFTALRNKHKMTQSDFARFLGVSVAAVSRWESGSRKITGLTETAILARAAAGTKRAPRAAKVNAND